MNKKDTKILLVDDEPDIIEIVGYNLKNAGYQVFTANNGKEALELLETNLADAILMDCQMPVMDGFEATRRIRALSEEIKHAPIIAVTANATYADREHCFNVGMNDYLCKPIKFKALKAKLSQWLE